MTNLVSCPGCGLTDHIYSQPMFYRVAKNGDTPIGWAILCALCGWKVEHHTKEQAEALWNKRPEGDPISRAEIAEEKLQRIIQWYYAYPEDIFPEPDLKRVRELLEAGGITIDSVSASMMRYLLKGIKEIVEAENGTTHTAQTF